MAMDPLAQFKAAQREAWALFAPLEASTTIPAAALVKFAQPVWPHVRAAPRGRSRGDVARSQARRVHSVLDVAARPDHRGLVCARRPLHAAASGSRAAALWGDPTVARERLGGAVRDLRFDRDMLAFPALSTQHYRRSIEATAGPVVKLVAALASDPERLRRFRSDLEALASAHFVDNTVRQHYLMTRATKV